MVNLITVTTRRLRVEVSCNTQTRVVAAKEQVPGSNKGKKGAAASRSARMNKLWDYFAQGMGMGSTWIRN